MTYEEREKIMGEALVDMTRGSISLIRLLYADQSGYLDKCSPTAIKTSKGKLDCAITWLLNAIKWEKECHEDCRKEGE